jgi:DNA-binding NarL/FixJ family response regulator
VILVADGPYPDWFQRALAVPVPGYLLRSSHPEELALSIHAVADGGFYYASAMQEYLLPDGPARPRPVQRNLSGEQWRILGLLVQGQTSKEIAKVVKKETRHVDRARQKILHRLGVPNTAALVAYAIQNELFLTARDGRRAPPNPATVDRPPDDGKAPGAKPRPKARARSHR